MKLSQWLGLACLVMAAYVAWEIRQLLLLLFLAIVLSTALNRLVKQLQTWGIKRPLALAITLISVTVTVALFFLLVIPPFWEQLQVLLSSLPKVGDRLERLFEDWHDRVEVQFFSQAFSVDDLPDSISALGANALSSLISFFSNSVTAVLQILFILAIAVMMLFSPQAYRRGTLKLFPSFYRRRADEILTQSESSLGNWLTGIVINSFFIAGLSGIGLWILQIKLVLVHALMAGILNFIPNIGPAASVVFPLMIAVLDAPWKIIAVLILYFLIQNVESYWLTPIVMAKQVSLLPAVTLIAQLFFASIFGLLGLILALPLTVVLKIWIEEALFKDLLDNWQ
ncbi:AI-2E family transporter [Synechocystis sp. LEGE 06083]|uniref:AI-2E family transporter n=1 Tax=Synechocystis sp. LEGE 06083 TaxID=915336 RepID=UPI001880BB56|nr:AI-2E family transporter [Synechocystis sp. LEGE 06083]MBE9194251.1 AI-2E family transporter [Synechocystis sp. LEGE 06083]